jgi:hypothetical protein
MTEAPAATEAAPEAAPAEAAAPEAAAEEAPAALPGWFRIDSDGLGLQLWAGTTNTIGGMNIATDIYVTGYTGEFDIGPAFAMGDLALAPMLGVSFDWGAKELASIVPQFYTIYNGDPIYFESWIQVFLNSPSDYAGGANNAYTRDFMLFKATPDFRIGPALELNLALNDAAKGSADKTLTSLAIGPAAAYNTFGDWKGSILLFLGVETQDASKKGDNLVGRMTYVHYF